VDEGVGLMFANEVALDDLVAVPSEGGQDYSKFVESCAG
jgi:hypothetical protein